MKLAWPAFRNEIRHGCLQCSGVIRSLPVTAAYAVRMEYHESNMPTVYVDDPELRRRDNGERCPHLYGDNEPCLYWPPGREWSPQMSLALTIIPWLHEWLVFYEGWLVTGEWQGGGYHPTPGQTKVSSDRADEGT